MQSLQFSEKNQIVGLLRSIVEGFEAVYPADMSEDKRKIEVRAAGLGDYEAVVAIPGNFFRGRDYLPKMYHVF